METLENIKTPDQFETIIGSLNIYPVTLLNGAKLITLLDATAIKLIKKKILNYINIWRVEPKKHGSAFQLMEDLAEQCLIFREREENYISSMKGNLSGIEANISKKRNHLPSDSQKVAMANLQSAIKSYEESNRIEAAISSDFFHRQLAESELGVFMRKFLGLDYNPAFLPFEYREFGNTIIQTLNRSRL